MKLLLVSILIVYYLSSEADACEDKQTWCSAYPKSKICVGAYVTWASNNCASYCNMCPTCDTTTEWCALDCKNSMCMYPGVGPKCTGEYATGNDLTPADKAAILKAHNDKRTYVSDGDQKGMPAASPAIPDLVYDDDLGALAQRWIEQCMFKHDHGKTKTFDSIGQNIYMSMSTAKPENADGEPDLAGPWGAAVDDWYNEVTTYLANDLNPSDFIDCPDCAAGKEVGHFTQVIWAKSTHVGCGYVRFVAEGAAADGYPYQVFVACNYGPAGNMLGAPIYSVKA